MNEFFNKVVTWVKENKMLAAGGVLVLLILLFPRFVRKLIGTSRVRHRRHLPRFVGRRRRSIPRSVGMYKRRKAYTKGGKAKKPWQIKGSLAARRHMAQIRKRRA